MRTRRWAKPWGGWLPWATCTPGSARCSLRSESSICARVTLAGATRGALPPLSRESSSSSRRCVSFLRSSCSRRRFSFSSCRGNRGRLCRQKLLGCPGWDPRGRCSLLPDPPPPRTPCTKGPGQLKSFTRVFPCAFAPKAERNACRGQKSKVFEGSIFLRLLCLSPIWIQDLCIASALWNSSTSSEHPTPSLLGTEGLGRVVHQDSPSPKGYQY